MNANAKKATYAQNSASSSMLSRRNSLRMLAQCIALLLVAASAGAQTGTVMPSPKFTIFDNSGNPVSGGKLCSYVAGTTTPANTYTDSTLTSANTNPVVADSAGRATVFLSSGSSYKFVARLAGSDSTCATGTVLWTVDNVLATPATTSNLDVLGTAGEAVSAGQVLYLSDGSGSKTPGQWYLAASANAYSSTTPILGVAVSAMASGASGTVRVGGTITGLSVTAGSTYYVSSTPGALSTSGAGSRRVGVADTTTSLVFAANPPLSTVTDVTGTAGETLTAGSAVYLSDGSGAKTAGQWFLATNANSYSALTPLIGVVPVAITSGQAGTIRLGGSVTGLAGLTAGTSYYIGTGGALTSTVPTAGNVRRVGVADTTTSIVVQGNPAPAPLNAWATVTTASTGTQNDFAPGLIGNTILRCNNATLLTITGLSGAYDGQRVVVVSVGAGQVDLSHQAAGSTAAYRLINAATSGASSLAAGSGVAEYVYDGTTARWRMVSHDQGGWLARTFASGDYTASTGNWTLVSGNTTYRYWLKGRTLTVIFDTTGSTTSAAPATLNIALPFTSATGTRAWAPAATFSNATANTGALVVLSAASTLNVYYSSGGAFGGAPNWVAAADDGVRGEVSFEVQ